MDVTSIPSVGNIKGISLEPQLLKPSVSTEFQTEMSFMDYLSAALGNVDQLQKTASTSAIDLVMGNETFLHNTLMAYDKANLALQLTIEVRNRLVESYQEIMRMQM